LRFYHFWKQSRRSFRSVENMVDLFYFFFCQFVCRSALNWFCWIYFNIDKSNYWLVFNFYQVVIIKRIAKLRNFSTTRGWPIKLFVYNYLVLWPVLFFCRLQYFMKMLICIIKIASYLIFSKLVFCLTFLKTFLQLYLKSNY